MKFLNRTEELARLDRLAVRKRGGLAVVHGRRRVGKTRLLLEWARKHGGLYTVADQSSPDVQRAYFAECVATRLPGFSDVEYPSWSGLLARLARDASRERWRGPLVLDELPYLVVTSPELPSVLQRWIDHDAKQARLLVAVAGSSQRLMQGLVLSGAAPLFGRAQEILGLRPLHPRFLREPLGISDPIRIAEHYAAWGGIPRYWELAAEQRGSLHSRIDRLVLDPMGPLHREPDRILIEEVPSAVEVRPILDAIGAGAHRLSEIAGRVGYPATSMSRPLERLVGLGLARREVPFGEPEKKTRRSLYRIDDPLFRLWFRVVAPYRAQLTAATRRGRLDLLSRHWPGLVSQAWEDICRMAVPTLSKRAVGRLGPWGAPARWWRAQQPEWDLLAESGSGRRLLLGEAKWKPRAFRRREVQRLTEEIAARSLPELGVRFETHEAVRALLVPELEAGVPRRHAGVHVVTGRELLS